MVTVVTGTSGILDLLAAGQIASAGLIPGQSIGIYPASVAAVRDARSKIIGGCVRCGRRLANEQQCGKLVRRTGTIPTLIALGPERD